MERHADVGTHLLEGGVADRLGDRGEILLMVDDLRDQAR